ncbi:hypothetical protein [Streptomyces sp. NPDC004296]|uniref:hypothetical protein n=1 Tax=Streptomyces sp. NPDC004296 TaxID=3364697 RepID=UPI0036925C51
MKTTFLPRRSAGRALVIGALLALAPAMSGVAYANTVSVTVQTPGATAGPGTTFSEISTHADCNSGLVSSGGLQQAIGTGTSSNGNHVMGTEPSSDGSTECTGTTGVVGTDNTHWLGIGGSGGAVKVHFTEVSTSSSAGANTVVTAGCGTDGNLVGGGARAGGGNVTTTDYTGPGSGGDHLNGSFPSDSGGNPAGNGTTTASYWSADAHAGGAGSTNTYADVWALCANDGT